MGNSAAATTEQVEESASLVTPQPAPSKDTSAETEVVSPVYMSSNQPLNKPTPNHSAIAANHASESRELSKTVASLADTESASSELDEESPVEEESAEEITGEDAADADESAEDEQVGAEDQEEEAQSEEQDQETEEETEQESAAGEDGAAGEEGAVKTEAAGDTVGAGSSNQRTVPAGGGDSEEPESIEVLVGKLPKMEPMRPPYVGSPPPQAIQRRDEIIKRTGAPPDMHHAKVRQAAEQVTQAARDAQRQMITRLGQIGRSSRLSIEQMADQILQATGAAVAQIKVAVDQAQADIKAVSKERLEYLKTAKMLVADELDKNQDEVTLKVVNQLKEGKSAIIDLDAKAQEQYSGFATDAQARVKNIPKAGEGGRVPSPPLPAGAEKPKEQEPPKAPKYKKVPDTTKDLTDFVDTSATTNSDGANCTSYYQQRAQPLVPGLSDRTQKDLEKRAEEKSKSLVSDATRAQYLIGLLGLTTPLIQHHDKDKSAAEKKADAALREQKSEVENARDRAHSTITFKTDGVCEYLRDKTFKDLSDNLWKSGTKAAKSFRKRALAAEVAQSNNAATMSEAYRSLVARLSALLPPGQFLDARQLVPQLLRERDAAARLRQQHELVAQEQGDQVVNQMAAAKQEQIEGLQKSVSEGQRSVSDIVTRTNFDMELHLAQVTSGMRVGSQAVFSAAGAYAEKTAKSIMDSVNSTDTRGILQIQNAAVDFLNGNIAGAEQTQYFSLEGFVDSMKKPGKEGPITGIIEETKGDLEGRADKIKTALPEPPSGAAVALGGAAMVLAAPVALPIAVGVGVHLYTHNPSENDLAVQLGVTYPGPNAIGEVYQRKGSGNLESNIKERLSNPEKDQILGLFSASEKERGDSKLAIAKRSLDWFGYNKEAREATAATVTEAEYKAMTPSKLAETKALLESDLDQNQADIAVSFLTHNRERAVAAQTREALDQATKSSSWGWIFSAQDAQRNSDRLRADAMTKMDSRLRQALAIENSFAAQMKDDELDSKRSKMFKEFASIQDPSRRSAASFGDQEAKDALVNYASKQHDAYVLGYNPLVSGALMLTPLAPFAMLGGVTVDKQQVGMSSNAKNYVSAVVNKGLNSDQAKEARGVYAISAAEQEDSPSETTQMALTEAVENRTLAAYERDSEDPRKSAQERSRAKRLANEERVKHRVRLQSMAKKLGAGDRASTPEEAEKYMRERVGSLFARTNTFSYELANKLGMDAGPSHSRYGEEMITHGRASLDATVALATDKLGTHEDLLLHGYAGRSPEEIARAKTRWADEHGGEDMDKMLGLEPKEDSTADAILKVASPGLWLAKSFYEGGETSGDVAMKLEVLARGEPQSDKERLEIARLRQQQEKRGTGFIADVTMSDTVEKQQMDSTQEQVAASILATAISKNPELASQFDPKNPLSIYGANGQLDERIAKAAFDDKGDFTGDRTIFSSSVATMGQTADAYRAEIDRQEAAITTFISAMAIIASIAIMLIPGVNVVAAGIAVALIAGAATIVVKAGMRGERYGWEEMATDVAMTAIEAATAGVSGGIAGGFKAGPLARLANVGKLLESGFGKIGGAIVREAVVNAVSHAASTALQDDVWKDGFSRGLQRVANGAIRGAVVGAVTTGVSEGITHGLGSKMSKVQADPTKIGFLQQLGERLGPRSSEMLREGIGNGLGALFSEAAGLGIDYAQGNFHGTFGDAIKQIGIATLRESVTGALRSGVMGMHKEHYQVLLEAAHKNPNLSAAELKALRLVGISAGVLNYDTSLSGLKAQLDAGRQILERLPPALREHVGGIGFDGLQQLGKMLDSADISYRTDSKAVGEHLEFIRGLELSMPGLDPRKLMSELDTLIDKRRAASQEGLAPEQQQALRARLGSQLHDSIRFALDNLPVEGLQHLNDAELLQAAAMVASGKFNSEQADQLVRAIKSRNADVDEHGFLSNLQSAVMQSGKLQQAAADTAFVRRQKLVELVPPEAAGLFVGLSDLDAVLAHNLLKNGDAGTPQQRDSLFQSARQQNPDLTREQFHGFMTKAAEAARTRIATEASAQRVKREEVMSNVPEHLRSVLSALPEAGLVELRLRQMEGSLSPAEKVRLLELAKKTTPDIDLHQLAHAIDEAIAKPAKQPLSDAQHADLRAHLLRGVPADLRSQIEHTPIMVLSESEFAALTRSAKGQAVTLIIDGKPVVILRESANPSALREEGIHALQAHDKQWAQHIGSLEEQHLADWDNLSIEEQLVLYRNKLALEVDAQQRVIASLEADITAAKTPEAKRALQRQLEQTRLAHENLSRRFGEVGGVSALDIANIKAGFSERPQWLDQPARLFNKAEDIEVATEKVHRKAQEDAAVRKKAEEERVEQDRLLKQLTSDMKTPKSIAEWHERMKTNLDLDSLQSLAALHPAPEVARQILKYALATVDPQGFIKQAHALVNRIGPDAGRELVGTAHGQKILASLAKTGQLGALDRVIFHSTNIEELRGVLVRLGSDNVSDPAKLLGHLDNVLSLLKTNQAFEFMSRLSSMQIENVPDHIEAFSHITRNINDPAQVQAFMHLVGRLSAGEYFDFVLKWGVISSTLFPQLEKGLPHFYQGKLLSRVIEMAATQHEWKAFFDSAHDLLHTINGLPKTPGNADAINKVMRYLLDPYGQPIHLAADVFASVDQLRAPGATREAIFALQASHLTGKKTDRLAGSDTWHTRMESEALRWNSFKNNAATKPFADLLANHPASKHWSEGELGIVSNMHKWFEHLANLHGIKSDDFSPAAVQAREKLLTEIFKRGFGPTGEQVVSSAGKLVDLNRAFREMVVEKVTGINLDQLSGPRDPARVAAALNRAGIGEHQFAHYSNAEREILLQHLYTLESRHAFYDTMKSLEHLGGGAHGAQQNITEVLGELALAAHMVINHQNLRLAIPFSKGTGFDQVWVGHNAAGEKIYVIGEAKGPGAELGAPGKGPQMSAEWVVNTLREMLTSSNSAERALAKEMLLAIIRARDESVKTGTPMPPIVSGVIIEAGNPANKADASTGASGYDFRAFDFTAHTNILAGK